MYMFTCVYTNRYIHLYLYIYVYENQSPVCLRLSTSKCGLKINNFRATVLATGCVDIRIQSSMFGWATVQSCLLRYNNAADKIYFSDKFFVKKPC